jgi:hypothetical protein
MSAVIGTNPDYVGLIGSKRRTNIVIDNYVLEVPLKINSRTFVLRLT